MNELKDQYKKILSDYITSQTERNLYIGQNFIKQLIQKNVAPEDVIYIHKEVLLELYPDIQKLTDSSFDFLIEIMIHYGLTFKDHNQNRLLEIKEERASERVCSDNDSKLKLEHDSSEK